LGLCRSCRWCDHPSKALALVLVLCSFSHFPSKPNHVKAADQGTQSLATRRPVKAPQGLDSSFVARTHKEEASSLLLLLCPVLVLVQALSSWGKDADADGSAPTTARTRASLSSPSSVAASTAAAAAAAAAAAPEETTTREKKGELSKRRTRATAVAAALRSSSFSPSCRHRPSCLDCGGCGGGEGRRGRRHATSCRRSC
jgi:hypothetical protein